jgi:hypothetical protein
MNAGVCAKFAVRLMLATSATMSGDEEKNAANCGILFSKAISVLPVPA